MSAAYDNFDYPAYWLNREYEHKSEIYALKEFFNKIHIAHTILEVGAGFGRLAGTYAYRGKKVILSDPSSKLLKISRETYANKKNIKYIHSSLENLNTKIKNGTIDVIVLIRVIHHLQNIEDSFAQISKMIKPGGYFIFEFANKRHFKAITKKMLKGDITFPLNIFTTDLRSKHSIQGNILPFFNYHPDKIEQILDNNGFKIISRRSVSNLRSSWVKKVLAIDTLLFFEKKLQSIFSYLNFGPSIFILARKVQS